MSSCRILLVVGTSYSTRYYPTISTLWMYMAESKWWSHTITYWLYTTALTPDDNICVWSSDKTSRWCIIERKLMAYVQVWYIDQLEKFSLHEQDILFPVAHKDCQSLRPSHLVKLLTSCPMPVKCIFITFLTTQSMWSPVLLTDTVLLYSSCFLAMHVSRATGLLYCIVGAVQQTCGAVV